MNAKEQIKQCIVKILSEYNEIPLTKLLQFEDFIKVGSGDLDWLINDKEGNCMNILFMSGLNLDCIQCFYELAKDDIIRITPINPWAYFWDVAPFYDLPIATRMISYKKTHWSPRLLKKGAKFNVQTK